MSLVYAFGQFELDPEGRRLLRNGVPVDLTSKCLDLLIMLVEQAGSTIFREELMTRLWGGVISEATLTQHVFMLRQALADERAPRDFLVTVPKVGYRFVADVRREGLGGVQDRTVTELCANARDFFERSSASALRSAIALYEQAVLIDRTCSTAHGGIAMGYTLLGDYFYTHPKNALEKAEASARRALAIDPSCALANLALGKFALDYRWDFAKAAQLFDVALAAAPHDSIAPFLSIWIRILQRRFREATGVLERELLRNPGNRMLPQCRGLIALFSGEYAEAVEELRAIAEREVDFWMPSVMLGQATFLNGDPEEAISLFERVWHSEYDSFMKNQPHVRFFAAAYLIFALFRSGHAGRAQDVWERMRRIEESQYVPAMLHAIAFAGSQRYEEASRWVDLSRENRESWYTHLAIEPFLRDVVGTNARREVT